MQFRIKWSINLKIYIMEKFELIISGSAYHGGEGFASIKEANTKKKH